jgi:hypothetical protein
MQIALKRFEQNLQGAKLDQQEEHDNQVAGVIGERMRKLAE